MPEAPAENDVQEVVVFERERKIIEEVLLAAIDPTLSRADASKFFQKMVSLGDSLPAALASSLQHPTLRCRVMAAWLYLKLSETAPAGIFRMKPLARAREVLINALKCDEYETRIFACVQLSKGAVPPDAIPELAALLEHSDPALSVFSAAALTWCGEAAAQGLSVLTKGIELDDDGLAGAAANALARLGLRREEAISALIQRLGNASASRQYPLILALRDVGEPASAASPMLIEIAESATAPSMIRGAAAEALGSIRPHDAAVHERLEKLLVESDWHVIEGALLGLNRSGAVSEFTLKRMREFLASGNSDVRGAVARGIQAMGLKAEPLLPELIDALCREVDRELLLELGRACAALGRRAAKTLCNVMQLGSFQHLGALTVALMFLGRDAAEEIATTLLPHADDAVRWSGVTMLRGLGVDSEPAIPALAVLLPELDDERAIYVLLMFGSWGERAAAAIPAITDCLTQRQGQVAEIAGNALVAMGKVAATHLDRCLASATEEGRRRMNQVISRIRPKVQMEFEKLLMLNADKELLLFAFVGKIIEDEGPIGFRTISERLEKLKPVVALGLPTSEAAVRKMLKDLNCGLGVSLTQSTTRGSLLTPEGKALVAEAREYLLWRGHDLVHGDQAG